MKNHLVLMLLFSILTSLVLTLIIKSDRREQVRYFFFLVLAFVGLSVLAGWIMYPFPF
jgi:cytochrome bd-type quinol oxidase subunit 2